MFCFLIWRWLHMCVCWKSSRSCTLTMCTLFYLRYAAFLKLLKWKPNQTKPASRGFLTHTVKKSRETTITFGWGERCQTVLSVVQQSPLGGGDHKEETTLSPELHLWEGGSGIRLRESRKRNTKLCSWEGPDLCVSVSFTSLWTTLCWWWLWKSRSSFDSASL